MKNPTGLGYTSPRRFDFVILVATPREESTVRGLLGLKYYCEEPLEYHWGYVKKGLNSVHVALVSLGDDQGPSAARSMTDKVLETLEPEYVLVLGHGAGISRKDFRVSSGTVVVSDFLSYGTLKSRKTEPLRQKRILPPSDKLLKLATRAANEGGAKNTKLILDREVISGPILQENEKDAVYQALMKNHPRFTLYEMEAGGVAEALLEHWNKRCSPSYLVIKGVSDVHKANSVSKKSVSKTTEENKRKREQERKAATRKAVVFARQIIRSFSRQKEETKPTPLRRLIPANRPGLVNENCAGVLHSILPEHYSQIAGFNLFQMLKEPFPEKERTVFTVCAYEPEQIWNILQNSYSSSHKKKGDLNLLCTWADKHFPHFSLFSNFAEKHPKKSFRVLLLRDEQWTSRINQNNWKLFNILNGKVPCWGNVKSYV